MQISRLHDFAISYNKTVYRILKQGPPWHFKHRGWSILTDERVFGTWSSIVKLFCSQTVHSLVIHIFVKWLFLAMGDDLRWAVASRLRDPEGEHCWTYWLLRNCTSQGTLVLDLYNFTTMQYFKCLSRIHAQIPNTFRLISIRFIQHKYITIHLQTIACFYKYNNIELKISHNMNTAFLYFETSTKVFRNCWHGGHLK